MDGGAWCVRVICDVCYPSLRPGIAPRSVDIRTENGGLLQTRVSEREGLVETGLVDKSFAFALDKQTKWWNPTSRPDGSL